MRKKIIVGFSGGVDSTMTVEKLKDAGFEPIAVFLKMFPKQNLKEAEKMAKKLDITLVIKDISEIFRSCIIDEFLKEYQNNQTPNPCVKCNYEVKFKFLLKIADEIGIEKIATGHYARIQEINGKFKLLKGLDVEKDQSYFLYRLTQKELSRISFPLGDEIKNEIKVKALNKKLFKEIKESQDVCFLGTGESTDYFLKNNLQDNPGEIQDEKGRVLGTHKGLAFYTWGQRKGLDLPGGPFYVIDKNISKNILVVSKDKENSDLINKEIYLKQVNWIFSKPDLNKKYDFKSRYRSKATSGKIKKEKNIWKIVLDKPQWAIAKGQSLVVYSGEEVVGGGIINKVK